MSYKSTDINKKITAAVAKTKVTNIEEKSFIMELEPDLQDSIGVIVGDGSFDVELDLCIVDVNATLVISIFDILTELVFVIDIII